MTITTKAALADELGVTRARVSQYVAKGLPVRPDGKLNRHDALNWLKLHAAGLNTLEDRGANRAARLAAGKPSPRKAAPAKPPPLKSESPAEAERAFEAAVPLLAVMVARSGEIAARAALEADSALPTAFAIERSVTQAMWRLADEVLGIGRGAYTPFEDEVNGRLADLDWSAIAKAIGERYDEAALDAFTDSLPSLQPEGELPFGEFVQPPPAPEP